jgi:hypothetical protein
MVLLDPPSQQLALFIDLFVFFSYIVMASFLIYVGKIVSYQKKLTLPWILIAGGLLFISLNIFVEIVGTVTQSYITPRPVLWYAFNIVGSIALITGFASVMVERQVEISNLRKRQLEIKDIMQYLKEQYYKKELGEDELRKLYADLVEQLAEIEVKIKRLETERKRK